LSTRRGIVLVALACTLIAGAILVFAMVSYRNSVDASGNPETVLVATSLISKSTPGEVVATSQMFKPTQIVARQVSAGAIADATALRGKVAVNDIYPGQQLTLSDFTSSGGLPAQLAPTERAITITLDQAHGMVGQVQDGDHVDVYAGLDLDSIAGRAVPVLRLLIPDVQVLKAGTASSSGSALGSGTTNGPTSQTNVTLKVSDADAGSLAYAADNGKVWLVLRPANAKSTNPPSSVTVQSLLQGSKPIINGGTR
jgi:Flp pilus assembly protein CpaB